MISFNLQCANDHVFEAWFKDSAAYDSQVAAKALACPGCGNSKIEKAIMAPNITGKSNAKSTDISPEMMQTALVKLRETVEANCDNVGADFPEEARKIHYGEVEHRDIYGQASAEEAQELSEEGVEFGRIPWAPRTDS